MAVVGCNIAWGVIDATLFVLNSLFHRSRRARFFACSRVYAARWEALAAVQEEFGLEDVPLAVLTREDRDRLYQSMIALSSRATPARSQPAAAGFRICFHRRLCPGLSHGLPSRRDPASFDFGSQLLALHVSNWVPIALLLLVGYWWGHYTDAPPGELG